MKTIDKLDAEMRRRRACKLEIEFHPRGYFTVSIGRGTGRARLLSKAIDRAIFDDELSSSTEDGEQR